MPSPHTGRGTPAGRGRAPAVDRRAAASSARDVGSPLSDTSCSTASSKRSTAGWRPAKTGLPQRSVNAYAMAPPSANDTNPMGMVHYPKCLRRRRHQRRSCAERSLRVASSPDDAGNLPDDLHPNDAGNERIAVRLATTAFGAGGPLAPAVGWHVRWPTPLLAILVRMRWPEGFLWGTGASSTQCEGAAPASDWWDWEQSGHAPLSGDGNGFATRYAEDFGRLAALGLTHHRLSVEWARLEPDQGDHDEDAIRHYRDVLDGGTRCRHRAVGLAPSLHPSPVVPRLRGIPRGGESDRGVAATCRLRGRDVR